MSKKIVEINGIKFEVDMSSAKMISEYRIGDKVNVLIKDYNERKVMPGIITGFNNFQELPTITICYLNITYSDAKLKYIHFNSETKDTSIAPCQESDILFNKADIVKQMERDIIKKEQELTESKMKLDYFLNNFNKHFESVSEKVVEGVGKEDV